MTAEKVEIVETSAETYGLNVTLDAIGLPKSTWYYWRNQKVDYEEKYGYLHKPLLEALNDNPAYGYRRVESELKARGYQVGETVVQRVLGMWDLSLRRWAGKPKPSVPRKLLAKGSDGMNLVARIEAPGPLQVFYTDFTEIPYGRGQQEGVLDAADRSRNEVGCGVGGGTSPEHGAGVGGAGDGCDDPG